MPNFNTHWLVALQATSAAPDYVVNGRRRYEEASKGYATWLWSFVEVAPDSASEDALRQRFLRARDAWQRALQTDAALPGTWDEVACFSAYMLGACGPDFWTLPSKSKREKIPDFAGKHFDLGHYNRTHRQFQVSVSKLAGGDDVQARLEKSYFLGMATHLAGDPVLHELVNVYAGAYNLLEKKWENEQGWLAKNIWSTHNKVEHYWDTYVRYRFLGDHGPVWGTDGRRAGSGASWFAPLELPTAGSLARWVKANREGKARSRLLAALGRDDVKFAIEKPLAFPWVVCDRVCATADLEPFVYSVVVDKTSGAYPETEVFELAKEEAEHFQMQDQRAAGGHSERKKLEFFTTDRNQGNDNCSNNYLTYVVCPDLEKVKEHGNGAFFELAALGKFAERAGSVAATFVRELSQAYAHPASRAPDAVRLPALGRFWNLDTGLGLQVRKVRSDLAKEVITQLDFTHVLGSARRAVPSASSAARTARGTSRWTAPSSTSRPSTRSRRTVPRSRSRASAPSRSTSSSSSGSRSSTRRRTR